MVYFIIIAIVLVVGVLSIKTVPQSQAYVIERLGEYKEVWSAGLHFKIPFIDQIIKKVTLKEQVEDFPLQPIITKDNIMLKIDATLYYHIADAKLYAYSVENPIKAVESLISVTLRNIVGDLKMDDAISSREYINAKTREVMDSALMRWGIRIIRVEVKNIIPPEEITDSIAKQMKAEHERQVLLDEYRNRETEM
ncbi:MAG: SPFH/Band 7/PHB domain protein [Lachnospiraceae bacterium]|nr:SPFH/Band 7/PHB domain protein [Lachnospiraceae bacterium]MDE6252103.1 SPFH/Band 7/PHB domain protein [Lachnospiraceae bacterium]